MLPGGFLSTKARVAVLDTSMFSDNLGDSIIMNAVYKELTESEVDVIGSVPTHKRFTPKDFDTVSKADLCVVGGTNLLSPSFNRQWDLGFQEVRALKGKCLLFGVGWHHYSNNPNFMMRNLYGLLLNPNVVHSVRDSYTAQKLDSLGFDVLNTTCPTFWNIPKRRMDLDPQNLGVLTLTDYSRKPESDKKIFQLAKSFFETLLFWPQGKEDLEYMKFLDIECEILNPNLSSFQYALEQGASYIGTRLHGGAFSMSKGNPTVIIAIDNRALEISKDLNLDVIPRSTINEVEELNFCNWNLNLPLQNIGLFKEQLRSL